MYKTGTEPPCDSFIITKTNCSTLNVLLRQQILAGHQNTSIQHPNTAAGVNEECSSSGWRAKGAELLLRREAGAERGLGTAIGTNARAGRVPGGGRAPPRISPCTVRCRRTLFVPAVAHPCLRQPRQPCVSQI